jgi:hypothetical protein
MSKNIQREGVVSTCMTVRGGELFLENKTAPGGEKRKHNM